eukprot:EC794511.1.p3 GENE.EC794511.1~~EC794511.1.p3  ORF type:complete len:130 (+),score=11.16 EC794511.1:127-516(+)
MSDMLAIGTFKAHAHMRSNQNASQAPACGEPDRRPNQGWKLTWEPLRQHALNNNQLKKNTQAHAHMRSNQNASQAPAWGEPDRRPNQGWKSTWEPLRTHALNNSQLKKHTVTTTARHPSCKEHYQHAQH